MFLDREGIIMKKAAIILATLLTSACATQPWSEVSGNLDQTAKKNLYSVNIIGINGESSLDNHARKTVKPGKVQLNLSTTKPSQTVGSAIAQYNNKTVELTFEPCVRYYVAAEHTSSSSFNKKEWQPLVLKKQPIKSCQKLLNKKSEELTTDTKLSI